MAELKKLFDVLDINPVLLDNPNTREQAVEKLLKKAQELCKAQQPDLQVTRKNMRTMRNNLR